MAWKAPAIPARSLRVAFDCLGLRGLGFIMGFKGLGFIGF